MVAETGSDELRDLAERLWAPLDSVTRLAMLEALSAAADEITGELAPGVGRGAPARPGPRVRRDAPAGRPAGRGAPPVGPAPGDDEEGGTAQLTLRLPNHLKPGIDEATARAGLSVNAWLVRAVAAALQPRPSPAGAARSGSATPAGCARAPRLDPPALSPPQNQRIPMRTFDTPEPIIATIDIAAGHVTLKATDRADTAVEVSPPATRPTTPTSAQPSRPSSTAPAASSSSRAPSSGSPRSSAAARPSTCWSSCPPVRPSTSSPGARSPVRAAWATRGSRLRSGHSAWKETGPARLPLRRGTSR